MAENPKELFCFPKEAKDVILIQRLHFLYLEGRRNIGERSRKTNIIRGPYLELWLRKALHSSELGIHM